MDILKKYSNPSSETVISSTERCDKQHSFRANLNTAKAPNPLISTNWFEAEKAYIITLGTEEHP